MQLHHIGRMPAFLQLQSGANGLDLFLVQPTHQLAYVLHLAATAFKVADAPCLGQGVQQRLRQLQPVEQAGAQRQ